MIVRDKLTAADFDAFLALPENASRRFELLEGDIVEKIPSQLHAYIISMLSHFLGMFLQQHPLGYALTEARYRLPDGTSDFIPDLSFVVRERAPLVSSGAAPYMPDLVVEVQSDGQSDRFMLDKALLMLAQGSRMVWIIYPKRQMIEVLTATDRQFLILTDTLEGGTVLPGFRVSVRDLFPPEGTFA